MTRTTVLKGRPEKKKKNIIAARGRASYSPADVVATIAFGSSLSTIFGVRLLLPAFRAPRAVLDNAFNMIENCIDDMYENELRRWPRLNVCRTGTRERRPDKMDDLRLCDRPRNRSVHLCAPISCAPPKHVFSRGRRTAGDTVTRNGWKTKSPAKKISNRVIAVPRYAVIVFINLSIMLSIRF